MRGVLPPQMGVVGVQPTAGGFDEVHLSSSHELFPGSNEGTLSIRRVLNLMDAQWLLLLLTFETGSL